MSFSVNESRSVEVERSSSARLDGQRVLVTGASGQLGRYLVPLARSAGAVVIALGRQSGDGIDVAVDLVDRESTLDAIASAEPDVVIHAAACTDVDGIEREPERGEAGNARATQNVVAAAIAVGAYLVAVGTDMVFPGDGGAPYVEDAKTRPLSAYGRSKLAAERAVLEGNPSFAVARTAWLYGGAGKHFPRTVLTVLRDRAAMDVVDDEFGSPTFAGDLAAALVSLSSARGGGVFHLVNQGRVSRFQLARGVARLAGVDEERVRPIATAEFLDRYPLTAPRPSDSELQNRRAAAFGINLPVWEEALSRYMPLLVAELEIGDVSATVGGS
jgi:dTDP-4-dehydrorhamnose reductase